MNSEHEDKVAQFSAVTGANPSTAETALASANWDLEGAINLYLAARDDDPEHDVDNEFGADEPVAAAPRAPLQEAGGATTAGAQRPPGQGPRPKQMTLQELQRQRGAADDSRKEEDESQDLFAGGEKSGLAVQNPDSGPPDHFRNIINQARQNHERPGGDDDDERQPASHFTGRAHTLGGDDAPSQLIEDPQAVPSTAQRLPRVTRALHLWADGISVDDGPLFRFDDPANQGIMAQINQGRAPMSLLDVQPGQEVDLNLNPHRDENYVQPKKKYKPFSGQGQRLGSPTPSATHSAASTPPPPPSSSSATAAGPSASTAPASGPAEVAVDESAPTLRLQIRLGDGSRLQSRFNNTHTIGDVYSFVDRAAAASSPHRPYVLITTFPNKEYTDKSLQLGDEFQRGGMLVQKWTS